MIRFALATAGLLFSFAANAARPGVRQAEGLLSQAAHIDVDEHAFNGLQAAKSAFLEKYGDDYGYGGRIDDLFATEIAPRMASKEHYLDWTAAALYWNSQVAAVAEELQQHVFGNPHCTSPSAVRTDTILEGVRAALLKFFNANPEEYTLVFTRSGTGALRLVGESFPWTPRSTFRFLRSNHNSVLGIREYARQHNASFGSIEEAEVQAWLEGAEPTQPDALVSAGRSLKVEAISGAVAEGAPEAGAAEGFMEDRSLSAQESSDLEPVYSLFAYPAYDNYAGVIYPLSWVRAVQDGSNGTHVWKVLLDAAAFVATHKLNLTETPADFVDLSLYKLFGYPTGVGALILRRENVPLLRKLYWGGGSVFLATLQLDWHLFRDAPSSYESGTMPFLDVIAVKHGLRMYEKLGGIEAIERHVTVVGEYLYDQLSSLRHSNGNPVVRVFGKHHLPNRRQVQGSTINFELLGRQGEVLSYKTAASVLADAKFHVRIGCTCNPGACYNATGVRDEEVRALAEKKQGDFEHWEWIWVHRDKLTKLPLGSIRVSLGSMSRFEDAHALVEFVRDTYTDAEPQDFSDYEGNSPLLQSHRRDDPFLC